MILTFAELRQHGVESIANHDAVGIQFQRLAVLLGGRLQIATCLPRRPECKLRTRISWVDFDRCHKGGDRFIEPPHLSERPPEIAVGLREGRFQPRRGGELLDRLLVPAQADQQDPVVVVSRVRSRAVAKRHLVVLQSLLNASLLGERTRQVSVRVRRIRIDFERLFETTDGVVNTSLMLEKVSEVPV